MAVNKVEYAGKVLLDLTEDTVTEENLLAGATAHDSSGQRIVGTMTQSGGIDTSDATALSEDIVSGKTAYVDSRKVTGSMVALIKSKLTVGMENLTMSKNSEDISMIFHNVSLNSASAYLKNKDDFRINGDGTLGICFGDATPEDVRKGKRFTSKYGIARGTMEESSGIDTSDATATAPDILNGKTAYGKDGKLTGSMRNNGAVNKSISNKSESYTIPQGYHNGSGKVAISDSEQAKIIASNIKKGVSILGVTGSYEGTASGGGAQVKTGTTTSTTINTGLSKIDKLIIYAEHISGKGAVDIIYTGESEAVVTYCNYYSNYTKGCAVQKRSAFGVSGGTFEWDDTGSYAFASGVTYHWIAFGS